MKSLIKIVFLGFLASTSLAHAESDNKMTLLSLLKTAQFSADFEQEISDSEGKLLERSQGHLNILQPTYFDWRVVQPYQQQIVNDGTYIWSYDVDFAQITQFHAHQSLQGTPAQLLTGEPGALKNYEVQSVPCEQVCFDLIATSEETPFRKSQFMFAKGDLVEIEMTDNLNQQSRLTFLNRNKNIQLKRSDFKFTPPKGVDVIAAK
jgi:outer membrane lipoprotein carrier protein